MKKNKTAHSISTFIGPETVVEGTIEFQGTIRIDGNVKGKICSNGGTVIVGEKAVINAEFIVDVAIIMGEIEGIIDARHKVEIYPPSRVVGEIKTPVISIETGVIFNGNCIMKGKTNAPSKAVDMIKNISDLEEIKEKEI